MKKLIVILFILASIIGNSQIMLKPNRAGHWESGTSPYGENLVTNGTFDSDLSSWTYNADWKWISGGYASHIPGSASYMYQNILTPGKTYYVTFTVGGRTAGEVLVKLGGQNGTSRASNGTFVEDITATLISSFRVTANGTTFDGWVDNIIVQEVL